MKPVGRTKWAETYYVDKDVENGKTYFYLVRSLKMIRGISLESRPSSVVQATVHTIRLRPPENINTASTDDGVRIYWRPVKIQGEETGYNIYRSESGQMFVKINRAPHPNPWFVDKDAKRGKTYRYAVTAFPKGKPEDESSRSASAAVKFVP